MMCWLPTGGFKWLDPETFVVTDSKWGGIPSAGGQNGDTYQTEDGCLVECDLEIPDHLHDFLNDFAPCPHTCVVDRHMLNPKQIPATRVSSSSSKLIVGLAPLQRYKVHITTLKVYLSLGVVLKKVHSVLAWKQSPWMRDFIKECSARRAKETTKFGKNFYKLMANSCYGKLLEDVMGHFSTHYTLCRSSATRMSMFSTSQSLRVWLCLSYPKL